MTIHNSRIEAAPGKTGAGGIRAKLYNRRLGLKGIVIGKVDDLTIDALATEVAPELGERVTVLLPTGSELCGIVSRTQGMDFSISLDPEIALDTPA